MNEFVILVAGGSGSRMNSDIPKQFISIGGSPILMHTIRAFRTYSKTLSIRVVLPKSQFPVWQELCLYHQFTEDYQLIAGGETRFDSVKNGLQSILGDEGLVAVHDGVRPFIPVPTIQQGFHTALEKGSSVTCVPLKDSVRIVEPNGQNSAVNRSDYRLIQTPQTFRLDWMRKAFDTAYHPHFTDCASVLETAGYPIHLIEGNYENIKITTPEDLIWAEAFLNQ
jgi:2-C-methyl-D-erythritol 4-phosphate cytidylyltransferase